jgi:hypothetical protein
MSDKDVIAGWLRLYNLLNGAKFSVTKWPDQLNRATKDIDALCEDDSGNQLAIEHTLIQAFTGDKADVAKFNQTLASLENNPRLVIPGYFVSVCQSVDSIPSGIKWSNLAAQLLTNLEEILPAVPAGRSEFSISVGSSTISLLIEKHSVQSGNKPSFTTGRFGAPIAGQELVMAALKAKIPKLAAYANAKKILLLEDDSFSGSIEDQMAQLQLTNEVETLLQKIDAIWKVDTGSLETESFIYTNDVWPTLRGAKGGLNLKTGEFF